MLACLSKFVETLLRPNQIGFRKGFSTLHNVLTLLMLIQQTHNEDSSLYVAFIDFRKALILFHKTCFGHSYSLWVFVKMFFSVIKALYKEATSRIHTAYDASI